MHKKRATNNSGFAAIIAVVGVISALVALGGFFLFSSKKPAEKETAPSDVATRNQLSPEIDKILVGKTQVVEELAQNPTVVTEAKKSSERNKDLTQEEIKALDKKWVGESEDSSYINGFITNPVALELIKFQEKNPGFVEIFLTDSKGLNAGQTNRTSDFYQADEDWWVDVYSQGSGKSYYGEIEYDESAGSQSVSIYVPVKDGKVVVGVIKAVLDILTIVKEL